MEAWLRTQLAIHELSVRAVLEHSRRAAIEAIACDPSFRACDLVAANEGIAPALA